MKVLVADDQALWRTCLADALGAWGYRAICVRDGASAWRALVEDPEIAILITDWVMPGLTGPELCRRIRALERPRYLPILLLTSRAGDDDLERALEAGADAFVRKPFRAAELHAQLRVAERILGLEERLARKVEETTRQLRRIDADLANAAAIQRALLPERAPDVRGAEIAWHYQACERLGGDLFHALRLGRDHLGVYVLDVSGHGTAAALHSLGLSRALSPASDRGGILMDGRTPRAPSEVAEALARRFPLLERSGQYLTLLYGVLELSTLRFRYVRAGHPGPVRVHRGESRFHDEGGGIPIGVTAQARYRDQELALAPGDSLWLFSDGVHETRDESGEEFGLERLLEATSAAAELDAQRSVSLVRRRLEDFRKQCPSRDDVTLLSLVLRPPRRRRRGALRLV